MSTYQCMYVLPEDKYRLMLSSSVQSPMTLETTPSTLPSSPSTIVRPPSSQFRCNICKKVFKNKQHLRMHLLAHKPQAGPGADKPEIGTEHPSEVRLGTI